MVPDDHMMDSVSIAASSASVDGLLVVCLVDMMRMLVMAVVHLAGSSLGCSSLVCMPSDWVCAVLRTLLWAVLSLSLSLSLLVFHFCDG